MALNLLAGGEFCCLLITFANRFVPDQARQNVGPDLDPNCLNSVGHDLDPNCLNYVGYDLEPVCLIL